MDRMKTAIEETILISFFAGFFLTSLYFIEEDCQIYTKFFASVAAIFFAKTVILRICCATNILKSYQAWVLSYKITAFFILPLFAVALAARFFF